MNSKTLAIFISGTGTNLSTIAIFCKNNPHLARVGIVVSNKAGVGGLEIAKEFGIPSIVIPTKGRAMEEFEAEVTVYLQGVDIICLAGFMRVLTPQFTNAWAGKMINIHPSLLPAFKGADAIGDALSHGVKMTGCTVHYVTAEIDSGEIISQKAVKISDGETRETLKPKMQNAESLAYTEALMKLTSF
jgi:formyltetrahydrofolate-dependent phosphoribosylglycinamide formyltransferase